MQFKIKFNKMFSQTIFDNVALTFKIKFNIDFLRNPIILTHWGKLSILC